MSYPILLKLKDRRCVVIGAGAVAQRRIERLLREEALVIVVAPEATETIRAQEDRGNLCWIRSDYSSEHLAGAFLVIAATDDRETNAAVCRKAMARGVLACCADRPDEGSFSIPAAVERGDLMIAVTTMGNSPTLASVLRMRLEEQFGPEWEHWTKLFGELRASIKTVESESGRKLLVGRILDDPAVGARIASGDLVGARKEAERCISSSPA